MFLQGWPLPRATEVWVMTSTSGASPMTTEARTAPWKQLSQQLSQLSWPRQITCSCKDAAGKPVLDAVQWQFMHMLPHTMYPAMLKSCARFRQLKSCIFVCKLVWSVGQCRVAHIYILNLKRKAELACLILGALTCSLYICQLQPETKFETSNVCQLHPQNTMGNKQYSNNCPSHWKHSRWALCTLHVTAHTDCILQRCNMSQKGNPCCLCSLQGTNHCIYTKLLA